MLTVSVKGIKVSGYLIFLPISDRLTITSLSASQDLHLIVILEVSPTDLDLIWVKI